MSDEAMLMDRREPSHFLLLPFHPLKKLISRSKATCVHVKAGSFGAQTRSLSCWSGRLSGLVTHLKKKLLKIFCKKLKKGARWEQMVNNPLTNLAKSRRWACIAQLKDGKTGGFIPSTCLVWPDP